MSNPGIGLARSMLLERRVFGYRKPAAASRRPVRAALSKVGLVKTGPVRTGVAGPKS